MSYRDHTTFDFEGARLWMLAGANGAGKSTVFDALRWVLFGVHRAGKQKPEQLIHHEAAKLLVEVELRLGEEVYKLKRTLGREGARPTWDVARRTGTAWESVAGTGMANEYNRWVEGHIGLTDEAFCASVYLSQGRADAILNADPEARYELLSQLVDLEVYERWHIQADERRSEARTEMVEARRRWEMTPLPDVERIEELRGRERELARELREGDAHVRELDGARVEASRWEEWSAKLEVLAVQNTSLRAVLGDEEAIEGDFARWEYLKRHQGAVEALEKNLRRRDELAGQFNVLKPQLEGAQDALDTARERNSRAQLTVGVAQDAMNEANARWSAVLSEVAAIAPQRGVIERRARLLTEREEQRQRLSGFESDLEARLEGAEGELERAREAARVLPLWKRFEAARQAFAGAQKQHGEWTKRQEKALERQRAGESELAEARAALEGATRELGEVREEAAKVAERGRALEVRRADFARVEGEARCHFCGQELSQEHRVAEVERLDEAARVIAREKVEANAILAVAQTNFEGARRTEAKAAQALAGASSDMAEAAREVRHQGDDVLREHAVARVAWEEIGETGRLRWGLENATLAMRDLSGVERPSQSDLVSLEAESKRVKTVEIEVTGLQKRRRDREVVAATIARTAEELEPLLREWSDVGVEAWRARAEQIEREKEAAQRERDGCQRELERVRTEATRAARDERGTHSLVDELRRQIGPVEGQLLAANGTVETAHSAFDAALGRRGEAPLLWQEAKTLREEWGRERKELEKGGVGVRHSALVEARGNLADVERERAFYREQIESLSLLARRPRAQVDAEWGDAKQKQQQFAGERETVGDTLRRLEREEKERGAMEVQLQERTLKHERWEELTRLLGPHQLQRHLLREAEGAIVREANGTLESISGGTLRLELVPDSDEGSGNRKPKVLDVVCFPLNGSEEPQAILPAFLSGSQRFRVAVALALGIGRTAARGNGNGRAARVETILIDEGFGSLDKTGRDEMKDELRELGRELGRVILVSHQEDFASAFPNRFNISLENGVSRVEKVVE